jgi:hypothetical protein
MRRRSLPSLSHPYGIVSLAIDALNVISFNRHHQWLESTAIFETEVTVLFVN